MRWLACGEMTTEKGNEVWWGGKENKARSRSWIYCAQRLHGLGTYKVSQSHAESSRLDWPQLRETSVIQVYAPTTDWPDDGVEVFYSQFENTVSKIPRKDITTIQGDFSAMIGSDVHTDWPETAGNFGAGPTN